jgi:2',3'-cyclic-nucleotide 2'-phosphodiesterase (5'-nucleotidase family)
MKKNIFLYLLFLWTVSCTPVKGDLTSSVSYTRIEQEKEDTKFNQLIAPYKAEIDLEMNKVIGNSEIAMPKVNGMPETLLGNFVADLVLEFSKTIDKETDFCLLNNGGLRSSLPEGDITIRNIFELMPFDNEIVIVTLDGASVNKIFSYIAERGGVPVSGVSLQLEKMNSTMVPSDIKIGGEKFSENETYKIATSDYLAGGGDSMNFWATGSIQTTLKKLRDAIIDFIRLKTAENKKLKPFLDNRITLIN